MDCMIWINENNTSIFCFFVSALLTDCRWGWRSEQLECHWCLGSERCRGQDIHLLYRWASATDTPGRIQYHSWDVGEITFAVCTSCSSKCQIAARRLHYYKPAFPCVTLMTFSGEYGYCLASRPLHLCISFWSTLTFLLWSRPVRYCALSLSLINYQLKCVCVWGFVLN